MIRTLLKPALIYVFDEPFNFLDRQNTLKVWEKIKNLKEEGKTVIVISHMEDGLDGWDQVIDLE